MQRIYRFIMHLVLFLFPLTILAANNLREEIINHVVDPCYITLASVVNLSHMSMISNL